MALIPLSLLLFLWQSDNLLDREDWKETPPELSLSQEHVAKPALSSTVHSPGAHGSKKSHYDWIPNDLYCVWLESCPENWAVSRCYNGWEMDLRGESPVRWRSKESGFRQLRLILRLYAGDWLVSDFWASESSDCGIYEFRLSEARWRSLDPLRPAEGHWVDAPDLSRIREVGFSGLMPGGGSDACSRIKWLQVYGRFAVEAKRGF